MTAGMVGRLGVVVGRCGKLQRNCLLLSFLLSIFAAVTWAGTGGAISGTVKDSSGAVVAKVTVTAIHIGTGVRQEVTTDDRGVYSFPVLSVGHYDLEFNGTGL
jgi:carboxypeptidase family protein